MNNDSIFLWKTADILNATKGELICGDISRTFSTLATDSRLIREDEFFVAIRGGNHDGHRFCDEVIRKGVKGVLIERPMAASLPLNDWKSKDIVCIAVPATLTALGQLASYHRKRSNVVLTAITGSNGKTTTRKMTAEVLSQKFCTHFTEGNFNNEIGLPLTLFRLAPAHRQSVVELGMNHSGEIRRLAKICLPDIAVITNIGPAHIEFFGTLENIMRAKGELLEELAPDKTAVLNADDPYLMRLASERNGKIMLFGMSETAQIRAVNIRNFELGTLFTLILPNEQVDVHLRIPGQFMVSNALAAASVGWLNSLSADEIRAGLEKSEPVHGRMNIILLANEVYLIDDTYNANPGSMKAAIKTLNSLKNNGRAIFVAGDMRELGEHSPRLHEEIGAEAARSGIAKLYVTGTFAQNFADGAILNGMAAKDVFIGTHDEIIAALSDELKRGDRVLVKGSRAMAMEKIVQQLKLKFETKTT
ncbi:MAG: UDP-N-acetylmuramoyl-tripeptide--D-alanyl-D-alanine ligase [Desulfobacteraceae bacterium]|nr:UDP-N-acetylmuramoyl-tripeptide--D-alanyl-D-alanine ligase [Desulfobacteraceae bacterium]